MTTKKSSKISLLDTRKTAIHRKRISAPTRYLVEQELVSGFVLDYGCGRGFDARMYRFDKYDPNFYPELTNAKYDTIICNYVLNVVEPEYVPWIVEDIESRLTKEGTAYISVRRDVGNTATQRDVRLDLPILFEKKGSFCIYETFR